MKLLNHFKNVAKKYETEHSKYYGLFLAKLKSKGRADSEILNFWAGTCTEGNHYKFYVVALLKQGVGKYTLVKWYGPIDVSSGTFTADPTSIVEGKQTFKSTMKAKQKTYKTEQFFI